MSETKSTYWEDRAKRLKAEPTPVEKRKAEGSPQKAVEPPKPAPQPSTINPQP